MRIAVISDIHGNFAALQAVVRDLETQHPDEVLVGGDLVLGGRQPAEVLDFLIERRWPAVLGNTDAFIVKLALGMANQSDPDLSMAVWAVDRLRPRHLEYLNELPMSRRCVLPDRHDLTLVHATPWSIVEMVLPGAREHTTRRMLKEAGAELAAIDQSGLPLSAGIRRLVRSGGPLDGPDPAA